MRVSRLVGRVLCPGASDPARLAASLEEFSCHPAYGLHQLRCDLERFVFLPGGSNGERLFCSWPAVWLPLSPGSIFHAE